MADKEEIRRYLQESTGGWHSLGDLKEHVQNASDRTLRRWLAEWVSQGELAREGEKRGARYQWVQAPDIAVQLPEVEQGLVFSTASQQLLDRMAAPLYTRTPVTYSQEWVESYVPNQTYYLTDEQRTYLHQQRTRAGIQGIAGTYIQKIFNRMLIDLSYHSARLEGNTYSIADTEQLVLQGISAEGKLDEERVMILNHKEAIRYLVQNAATLQSNEETIRTLHYLLADSLVAPGMAGQVRDESIGVSGTTYAPLEGKERLTQLLINLLNKAQAIEDCFEQSFFLLGHIAYLQAFIDVNKRTARLASIIPLITNDYVPQSFVDVDKESYLKATLCFYEFNEVGPLAELYIWSYHRSCQHYDITAQVVGFDEVAALYRAQRRALVSLIVKEKIQLSEVANFASQHIPNEVTENHRDRFLQTIQDELTHLDFSRMAGLGITRQEMQAWIEAREKDQ